MSELSLRLTALEIMVRRAWVDDRFQERRTHLPGEMADTLDKETQKIMTRKCICCGAPGYEVDH